MPLFEINGLTAKKLKVNKFKKERELQQLFERNLEELLGVKFLASEYSTTHGGRIDTLGIDENNCPVIIEYKRDEKDNVINQGLFYLDWLVDHKGDFELLIRNKLKKDITVNWDSPRLILVAQSFNKYDKYAVHKISENIELKRYVRYGNNLLLIDNINIPDEKVSGNSGQYTIQYHFKGKPQDVINLFNELREKILSLDEDINEKALKFYIAYKLNKNFTEIIVQSKGLKVHFDIDKSKVNDPENKLEDVSDKGHWATGQLVMKVNTPEDIDYCINIIKQSYENQL